MNPFNSEPVWSDHFDGNTLDRSKWECEVNAFGGGNNELQIYTDHPKNVRVECSKLILEAHHEPTCMQGTVRQYSSGRVCTKHRHLLVESDRDGSGKSIPKDECRIELHQC